MQVMGEKNWQQISHCFDNRSAAQCMYRWTKSISPAIRRGRWTEEEDSALRIAAVMYGESFWTKVQRHILGRTDVQCRERYMNVLSPNVKSGPWTKEENERLMELVEVDGLTRWSDVALRMQGRTDNQCSRRYKMIHRERDETKPLYLSGRRRPGRTTISQMQEPSKESEVILRRKRKKEQLVAKHQREALLKRAKSLQEQDLRVEYDAVAGRHCLIYKKWDERYGKFLDPIEKVFNLGIAPATKLQHEAEDDQTSSITNPNVPEPDSVLRPGTIRPVPPCYATLTAFKENIVQGEHADGRFKIRHTIDNGKVVVNPLKTAPLSSEEMQRPEFKELADRFDAVFLWPMMMGMLHMDAARELATIPAQEILQDGTPSQLSGSNSNSSGDSDRPMSL